MRSSPETAIIEQPTAATKLPSATSTTTPSSDAIDAAVSTQQPAATPATSSDASDIAVASQQPAATPATSSDASDTAVASQQPAATTTTNSDAANTAVASQQPAATTTANSDAANTAVASQQPVDSTAKASDKVDSVQDVTDFTQTLMKDTCHADRKRLKCTMYCFFLAVVVIMDGRRDGALWDDIYDMYRMLCAYNHFSPCGKRALERFVKFATRKLPPADSNAEANGDAANMEENEKDKRFISCKLTRLAAQIVDAISKQACKGILDEGEQVLEALHKMFPDADFQRVVLVDGSHNHLADGASEESQSQDDAEPNEAKGLSGTCSRKLHIANDLVSRGVIAFKLTAGTFSEKAVLKQWILEGVIKPGDLLICDAGYFSTEVIELLKQYGVFFVIKGKGNLNPEVLAYVHYHTHKTAIPSHLLPPRLAASGAIEISDWLTCDDQPLAEWDIQKGGNKTYKELVCGPEEIIDANVRMKGVTMRMVQIYNPTKDRSGKDESPYVYISTNLPAQSSSPMAIWALSRVRWGVELFFKGLKYFCFMNGWDTDRIGRADFFIMMALAAFQLKVLYAQAVQAKTKKTLSMLSSCKVHRINILSYIGLPHPFYGIGRS